MQSKIRRGARNDLLKKLQSVDIKIIHPTLTYIYPFGKYMSTYYVPGTECLEIGHAEGQGDGNILGKRNRICKRSKIRFAGSGLTALRARWIREAGRFARDTRKV